MTSLLALGCQRRILLTGTPVQNNLDEFFGKCCCWTDTYGNDDLSYGFDCCRRFDRVHYRVPGQMCGTLLSVDYPGYACLLGN